jgi:hypothetical protein
VRKDDIGSFRSGYADSIGYTVKNMKSVKAENLITELGEYSACLRAACDVMRKADESLAGKYAQGDGGG